MTRRHDERWAIPVGNDEYIHRMEEEFHRLRQVERTLEGHIDFLRSERDRLKDAAEELIAELNEARLQLKEETMRTMSTDAMGTPSTPTLSTVVGIRPAELARLRRIEEAARAVVANRNTDRDGIGVGALQSALEEETT